MGTTNENPHYGPARNPWDQTWISGGSSGGSGVATAARLVAAAIGTDTGGSIRIPAALCGCLGLKPSFGLASRTGVFPLSGSRDHIGPLARTVEDAALVLQAIVGYDPHDPESVAIAPVDYLATLRQGVAGLRIGVPGGRRASLPTTEVGQAIGSAAEILAGLDAEVMPVELDDALDLSTVSTMSAVESRYYHREFLPHRLPEYGPDLQTIFSGPEPDRAAISAAMAKGRGDPRGLPARARYGRSVDHPDGTLPGTTDRHIGLRDGRPGLHPARSRRIHAAGELCPGAGAHGARRLLRNATAHRAHDHWAKVRRRHGPPRRLRLPTGHQLAPPAAPKCRTDAHAPRVRASAGAS